MGILEDIDSPIPEDADSNELSPHVIFVFSVSHVESDELFESERFVKLSPAGTGTGFSSFLEHSPSMRSISLINRKP